MRIIIAGGRDYRFTIGDVSWLDWLKNRVAITEVVSGGATGADTCGEQWAHSSGIPVKRFPANWDLHGKAAGPIRNREMAEYADGVILFPGGRGTDNMADTARKSGIAIWDWRVNRNVPSKI